MRDILGSLVARSLGLERSVEPRLPTRFESNVGAAPTMVHEVQETTTPPRQEHVTKPAFEGRPNPPERSVMVEEPVRREGIEPSEVVPKPAPGAALESPARTVERQHIVELSEREITIQRQAPITRTVEEKRPKLERLVMREPSVVPLPQRPHTPLELARQILPPEERPARGDIRPRSMPKIDPTRDALKMPAEPTIEVTIGRLEIRATSAPAAAKTQRTQKPAMTIDEYAQRGSK